MSDERDGGASAVILSFLLGGVTGAALALLYAPRSGQETRDLLSERMREGVEKGRGLRETAVSRGRELIDEAADYVERQRDTLERTKERLATAVDAGRQAYRDEKSKA